MRFVVPILLTLVFSVFVLAILGMTTFWVEWQKPDPQPIAYPHDFHAGSAITTLSDGKVAAGLGLQCTHCHQYVDKSRFATIPAVSICAECHTKLPPRTEELQKLKAYLDNNEPIVWQRIHSVPQHVYFSHKRHVKYYADEKGMDVGNGEICAKCHGNMQVVKEVKQVTTLRMGFCVSCHRAENAPQDCWTCHK